jgi:FixJ family two-component response regulator
MHPATVYVIDDDPEVLQATERLLVSADHQVNLMRKLGVRSVAELVKLAQRAGAATGSER